MKAQTLLIWLFSLLLLSTISAGCSRTGTLSEADKSAELAQRTRDFLSAYTAHDVDKVISFFAEDAENTDLNGKVIKDMAGLRRIAENMFEEFPNFRIEVQDVFTKGNRVCARYVVTGTGSGEGLAGKAIAGKTISLPGASILEWKDGKIFRSYNYRNEALAMRQLGLLRP